MSTTGRVGLLIVHGRARCPSRGWYTKEPHDKGEKAVGFMVSTATGKVGGIKRVKDSVRSGSEAYEASSPNVLVLSI